MLFSLATFLDNYFDEIFSHKTKLNHTLYPLQVVNFNSMARYCQPGSALLPELDQKVVQLGDTDGQNSSKQNRFFERDNEYKMQNFKPRSFK